MGGEGATRLPGPAGPGPSPCPPTRPRPPRAVHMLGVQRGGPAWKTPEIPRAGQGTVGRGWGQQEEGQAGHGQGCLERHRKVGVSMFHTPLPPITPSAGQLCRIPALCLHLLCVSSLLSKAPTICRWSPPLHPTSGSPHLDLEQKPGVPTSASVLRPRFWGSRG